MALFMRTGPVDVPCDIPGATQTLRAWGDVDGNVHELLEAPDDASVHRSPDSVVVELFAPAERWLAVPEVP